MVPTPGYIINFIILVVNAFSSFFSPIQPFRPTANPWAVRTPLLAVVTASYLGGGDRETSERLRNDLTLTKAAHSTHSNLSVPQMWWAISRSASPKQLLQ